MSYFEFDASQEAMYRWHFEGAEATKMIINGAVLTVFTKNKKCSLNWGLKDEAVIPYRFFECCKFLGFIICDGGNFEDRDNPRDHYIFNADLLKKERKRRKQN